MIAVDKCIVCDSDKQVSFGTMKNDPYYKRISGRTNYDVSYVACKDCGLVYQNPVLGEHEMEELYSEKYRSDLEDKHDRFLKQANYFREHLYPWITEHIHLNGEKSVLDIGCGAGTILMPFKDNGWETYGIEPTKNISEYGRQNFGSNIKTGFYDRYSYPDKKFKLIIFSHVLEHVLYPEKILHDIKENMDEESYLFIGTPNVTLPMMPGGILHGDHIWLFSDRTLKLYLEKLGFDIVVMDNWVPRGLRVIVKMSSNNADRQLNTQQADDYRAVKRLYKNIKLKEFEQFSKTVIVRNSVLVNKLCGNIDMNGIRLVKSREGIVNAVMATNDKKILLYKCKNPRNAASDIIKAIDLDGYKVIILFGYGLGYLPKVLLKTLREDQRLIVYEDNIPLLKSAFLYLNLLGFLNDKRVIIAINREKLISHLKEFIKETMTKDFLIMTNSLIDHDYLNRFKKIMDSL
ncbi:MAG: hypothetical protein A2X55_11470 [Nitrospirae bacterium GWB2_47_37]|nr:MAG: hypothetical protein A2X55_11470 [Nitrospirae bacterium GWB2_47_37]HAK87971.1 hypothetical protein [Nitrospiraceae bacterium]